jgi:hypothetical protein
MIELAYYLNAYFNINLLNNHLSNQFEGNFVFEYLYNCT